MDIAGQVPCGNHVASLGPDCLSGCQGCCEDPAWHCMVQSSREAGSRHFRSFFPFPAHPHSRSTLGAQVATGSLLPAALLPFSRWVAVFFLFYVFYFLSCCQSKPLLKPA